MWSIESNLLNYYRSRLVQSIMDYSLHISITHEEKNAQVYHIETLATGNQGNRSSLTIYM